VSHRFRLLISAMLLAAGVTACAQDGRRGPKIVASQTIHCGDALLQVDFGEGKFDLPNDRIVARIQNVANAVAHFYGRFPVARTRIIVTPDEGRHGVLSGTTWGNRDGFSAYLKIRIGSATTNEELVDDWILTHEIVHTAFASLPDDQHWLEEGLASYIEPFIRTEAGEMSREVMWSGMVHGMPNGEPKADDKGLNNTHTWGRTYWGGALFCLVADTRIRKETANSKGLPDALRAIVAAGETIDKETPLDKVLATGDDAIGTHVLTALYREWGDTPVMVDLPAMWRDLGIEPSGSTVVLNSTAPHASMRVAMTTPVSSK
jgi:hypothetical protein